jgi:DNA-binding response OmpR family regulator
VSERGALLVVDDDQDVRETVRDYFEHHGFDVFVASDGEGMRKVLAARRVDLVLMDLKRMDSLSRASSGPSKISG